MFDPNELKALEKGNKAVSSNVSRSVEIEPLNAEAFAPFGDVLEAVGTPDRLVDRGRCGRYDDRARLDFKDGRPSLNMLLSEARHLPIKLNMVLRHSMGTKCVMPMTQNPFLVIVAPEENGTPGRPRAFVTHAGQGVNYHRGIWHHILTPLVPPGLFCVLDRAEDHSGAEEFWFDRPYMIIGSKN